MGEKGWKALIPFYNLYILTKRVSNGKYFISLLSLTIAALVCSTVLNILSGLNITGVAVTLVNVLSSGISIAAFVIEILLLHKVSKAFGHGGGFTVGLVFLTFIFELILAFGSSQYIGCQDNAEK